MMERLSHHSHRLFVKILNQIMMEFVSKIIKIIPLTFHFIGLILIVMDLVENRKFYHFRPLQRKLDSNSQKLDRDYVGKIVMVAEIATVEVR